MRSLSLELDYRSMWRDIFGANASKVRVLEVVRCLKCDLEGFAIICKIKLRDGRMNVSELLGKGALKSVETLYEERDGSSTVLLHGKLPLPQGLNRRIPSMKLLSTPQFVDVNRMKVELFGKESEIKELLLFAERSKVAHRILTLAALKPGSGSQFPGLTSKQRHALLAAYVLGYYDVPRRISSEELGKHLGIDKSTLVEHLRKAERTLVANSVAG